MNLQRAVPGAGEAGSSNLASQVERDRVFDNMVYAFTDSYAEASSNLASQVERDLVFDNMVHAFTDSYAEAYTNVQFSELVDLAIKHFNKTAKKKDKIFGLPCLHSMCSFFEKESDSSHKNHYVHLNLSVDRAMNTSTTMLFFGELIKNVKEDTKPSTWTVLSCQPLGSESSGGLNGRAFGSTKGRKGSRKRKRLESCFACEEDIKHPRDGYTAGHFVNYTYR